ncbi:LysR family transcriptional regulator [Granulicella arctica]|uniref:DNA-binding transcriptional LysR family regulator n=1 Tax=Granulicella arctica TaxID=940613 RepID=A0A7Y9PIP7_9BACT|nr:LysR family transcriptional regulator [Granulicella arctica]NYF80633.1 DNA-binding transcriptional LysR family regulator [Granulicella arctica]
MEMPDLNDVRTFVAIGQEGTLTAAARELKLPTSTVSRALTRLEKHLGVLLAQRSPRGLVMTDFGKEYLQSCRRALRTLREGSELVERHRERPSGLIKVACPITMARSIFGPLLKEFLDRYPDLRVELEPYTAGWDHEPREDVDVFFKVRAPRDSIRRVRPYSGTKRGLFASPGYIALHGAPATPDELVSHTCIGSGTWKLSRGSKTTAPNIVFKVVVTDPVVHLDLALSGLGIVTLPLYMAKRADMRNRLIPVLPHWNPEPITLCALFSGQARLTPKVHVLLDFLGEYIGTDRDPRLQRVPAKGLFTDPKLEATSGP